MSVPLDGLQGKPKLMDAGRGERLEDQEGEGIKVQEAKLPAMSIEHYDLLEQPGNSLVEMEKDPDPLIVILKVLAPLFVWANVGFWVVELEPDMISSNTAAWVFWTSLVVCYAIYLPLWVFLENRKQWREQHEIAANGMALFDSRVIALYSAPKPAVEDARAAEIFQLYSQAQEELEKDPRHTREIIERGVSLAEEVLDISSSPESGEP